MPAQMETPSIPDFPMAGMSREGLVLMRRHVKALLVMLDNLIVQKDIDSRSQSVVKSR